MTKYTSESELQALELTAQALPSFLSGGEHGDVYLHGAQTHAIAATREAVPALIAEIRRLRRTVQGHGHEIRRSHAALDLAGVDKSAIDSAIAAGRQAMRRQVIMEPDVFEGAEQLDREAKEELGEEIARAVLRAAGVRL